jgi:tetratricopeptide (TPR) repeat protein
VEVAFDQRGADAGRSLYQELKGKYPAVVTEETLNTVGYGLLARGHTSQAVAALQFNAELFPQSANVFDSLGEALAAGGDMTKAIANYQKSLALNPDNPAGKKKLEELQKKNR